jgi:hypothetical protein
MDAAAKAADIVIGREPTPKAVADLIALIATARADRFLEALKNRAPVLT